jgi:hypothetical protein
VTLVTGDPVTEIVAAPTTPSLVAVIRAVPGESPVTTPVPLTLATDGEEEFQDTDRPDRGAPPPSLGVAVKVSV